MASVASQPAKQRPVKPLAPTIVKRLHISGLSNPNISHADLRQRFSSFGDVQGVEGVGVDGNGFPRSFAFVTLSSTAPQIARLLSLLNGATWKSCVLRIGEARPTWDLRLEKEREAVKRAAEDVESDGKKKKKMKLGKGVKGTEAKQMDPIDLESAADKKHWHLTPLQHLIRPLVLQPLHPIPRPTLPVPPSSSSSSKASSSKTTAAEVKKKKTGKRSDTAPKRARKVVVDPRRYERTHLAGDMLDPGSSLGQGSHLWVCEEGRDGKVVWTSKEGRQEVVTVDRIQRLKAVLRSLSKGESTVDDVRQVLESVQDESSEEEMDEDNWPSLGGLAGSKAAGLFDDEDADDNAPSEANEEEEDDDAEDDFPNLAPAGERAASPLFASTSTPPPAPPAPLPTTKAAPVVASQPAVTPAPALALKGTPFAEPISKETTGPSNPTLRAPSQPSKKASKSKSTPASKKAVDLELAALVEAEKSRGMSAFASLFGADDDKPAADEEVVEKDRLGAVSFLDDEDDVPGAGKSAKLPAGLPAWAYDDSSDEDDAPAPPPAAPVVAAPTPAPAPTVKAPSPIKARAPVTKAAPTVKKQVTFEASVPVPLSPSPEPTPAPEDTVMEDELEELDPVQLAMKELRDWEDAQEAKREAEGAALRLRGGAREESSDEDSEDEMEVDGKQGRRKTDVNQLKAMFAPRTTEAPSFSLFSGVDIDIDETEDPTLTAVLPSRRSPPPHMAGASMGAYVHPSRAFAPGLASMYTAPQPPSVPLGKQPFRPDASTPYFFSHLHLTEAEAAKGPKIQSKSLLVIEAEKKFNTGVDGFWAPEEETGEKMQEKWEEVKGILTKDWKARWKNGKKKGGRGGFKKPGQEEEGGEGAN